MTNGIPGPELSPRTADMVGRKEQIKQLHTHLHDRGARHFVYYRAHGGLGKTRLLQELQRMVKDAGPGFYTSGIIDLYHTDTHSISDIERAIVEGLDPKSKYFPEYRRQRIEFEQARERGVDPALVELYRASTTSAFVQDCRAMALDARKLVLCFDTIELLQYESSAVEKVVGPEAVDTRLKPWLLSNLSDLANVLVVFAGRPKESLSDQSADLPTRLERDMQDAFGDDLSIVELEPFDLQESREFIRTLKPDLEKKLIDKELLPVVHRLAGGRPIMLHLLVDLIETLSPEPRCILELFERYKNLVDAPEDDSELQEARQSIEKELVRGVFSQAGMLGAYLIQIALMPKGVDPEILQQALGLPLKEAQELLDNLEPLSFIKRYIPPPGSVRLHGERVFLHDEMYRLLTLPGIVPHLTINERTIAHALTQGYYSPLIETLDQNIASSAREQRHTLRERKQKLQVERLYYLLAQDPHHGYDEYRSLSEEANRQRWVGFSMRLLDEFLRFYNTPYRKKILDSSGLTSERVNRDSALMWVERVHWWGQRESAVRIGGRILDDPDAVSICPDRDLDILGNICALWARAYAIVDGYNEGAVRRAQEILDQLPEVPDCSPAQALARARLAVSIGYHHRLAGMFRQAIQEYKESVAAFRRVGGHQDEHIMVLNNLAFAHALQGQFTPARALAHEALEMTRGMGHDYTTGLVLSTLASIAMHRRAYHKALEYGQEALAIFERIKDAHGRVLAYETLAKASRWSAKHDYRMDRRMEAAGTLLDEADSYIKSALEVLETADLGSKRSIPIHSEQGRLYRSMGHWSNQMGELDRARSYYREAEGTFRQVLKEDLSKAERADILQDLAEVQYALGDDQGAEETLKNVEETVGSGYLIVFGHSLPEKTLPNDCFAPLGKVEWLRGRMMLDKKEIERAAQHYLLAYAYFAHFAPRHEQLHQIVEDLYKHLRRLSMAQVSRFRDSVQKLTVQHEFGVDMTPFVQDLEQLL